MLCVRLGPPPLPTSHPGVTRLQAWNLVGSLLAASVQGSLWWFGLVGSDDCSDVSPGKSCSTVSLSQEPYALLPHPLIPKQWPP